MSGLVPLQPQGPLILAALRLVEGASTLEATPGAELKAVLAEINARGLLLLLADGRSLTATGELPYPAGTALTFRIQPQADGTTQLQPLRADPPPPPALLAPLVQGEAASLLQRLTAPDLPTELLPLKALLDRLPSAPQPAPAPFLPPSLAPLAEAVGLPVGLPVAAGGLRTPPNFPAPAAPQNLAAERTLGSESPGLATANPAPSRPEGAPPSVSALATRFEARGILPEPARALALLLVGEAAPEAAPLGRAPETGRTAAAGRMDEAAPLPARPREAPPTVEPAPAPARASPEGASLEALPAPSPAHRGPLIAEPAVDRALLRAFGLPESLIRALVPAKAEGEGLRPPAQAQAQASASASAPASTPAEAIPEANARLRQLLERLPAPLAQRVLALLTLLPPAGQGPVLSRQDPLAQLIRSLLPQLQQAASEGPAERASAPSREGSAPAPLPPSEPATWARWLKEVVSTLSRPEASPAEAPFHRLQAREGTALFEVPLPWTTGHGTLELWAERDAAGPDRAEVHRVLLALSLGRTGELRVALQSGPSGVQAQVVASPEVATRLEAILREELGEPGPFPLLVRAAASLPPRPRALAGGGLQALG